MRERRERRSESSERRRTGTQSRCSSGRSSSRGSDATHAKAKSGKLLERKSRTRNLDAYMASSSPSSSSRDLMGSRLGSADDSLDGALGATEDPFAHLMVANETGATEVAENEVLADEIGGRGGSAEIMASIFKPTSAEDFGSTADEGDATAEETANSASADEVSSSAVSGKDGPVIEDPRASEEVAASAFATQYWQGEADSTAEPHNGASENIASPEGVQDAADGVHGSCEQEPAAKTSTASVYANVSAKLDALDMMNDDTPLLEDEDYDQGEEIFIPSEEQKEEREREVPKCADFPGERWTEVDSFLDTFRGFYGMSADMAWSSLFGVEKESVKYMEFCKGVRKLKFQGNLKVLWGRFVGGDAAKAELTPTDVEENIFAVAREDVQ